MQCQSDQDRELIIGELFETLEMAYNHIGRACSLIGALSKTLNSSQLFAVLKASVRPVVHINALPKFNGTSQPGGQTHKCSR